MASNLLCLVKKANLQQNRHRNNSIRLKCIGQPQPEMGGKKLIQLFLHTMCRYFFDRILVYCVVLSNWHDDSIALNTAPETNINQRLFQFFWRDLHVMKTENGILFKQIFNWKFLRKKKPLSKLGRRKSSVVFVLPFLRTVFHVLFLLPFFSLSFPIYWTLEPHTIFWQSFNAMQTY